MLLMTLYRFTLYIVFLQQKDEQGFEYIGGSIANGFYGFIGSSFRKSKFLFRAMEHFAARVNVGLIMILYILSSLIKNKSKNQND